MVQVVQERTLGFQGTLLSSTGRKKGLRRGPSSVRSTTPWGGLICLAGNVDRGSMESSIDALGAA